MISKTMRALPLISLFALFAAADGYAQSATPEGDTIQNIATVNFTDANGNTYAAVADTVEVVVGFAAGVDVDGPATASPAPASFDNTLAYTMQNLGNGRDSMTVTTTVDPAVMTNVRYRFNLTDYGSAAALTTALLAHGAIAQDSTIDILVLYDVPAGAGGLSGDFAMTATSERDTNVDDTFTTTITASETVGVVVTPDDSALQRLPNSGTVPNYVDNFWVKNTGDGPEDFTIAASTSNPTVITSATPSVALISALAAGDSVQVSVTYVVANVAPASIDTLFLTATSVTGPGTAEDSGSYIVTVVKPAIAVVKEAFRDNQSDSIGAADRVLPGEFIQYRITVSNTGVAAAVNVHVDDLLPAELTWNANTDPGAFGWTFGVSGNDVDADLASLAGSGSAYFWIRAEVK